MDFAKILFSAHKSQNSPLFTLGCKKLDVHQSWMYLHGVRDLKLNTREVIGRKQPSSTKLM